MAAAVLASPLGGLGQPARTLGACESVRGGLGGLALNLASGEARPALLLLDQHSSGTLSSGWMSREHAECRGHTKRRLSMRRHQHAGGRLQRAADVACQRPAPLLCTAVTWKLSRHRTKRTGCCSPWPGVAAQPGTVTGGSGGGGTAATAMLPSTSTLTKGPFGADRFKTTRCLARAARQRGVAQQQRSQRSAVSAAAAHGRPAKTATQPCHNPAHS